MATAARVMSDASVAEVLRALAMTCRRPAIAAAQLTLAAGLVAGYRAAEKGTGPRDAVVVGLRFNSYLDSSSAVPFSVKWQGMRPERTPSLVGNNSASQQVDPRVGGGGKRKKS